MKLFFAGDHAGFELKKELIAFVRGLGHVAEDCGPSSFDPTDDYPDYVIPLAKKVASYSPLTKGALPSTAGGMLTTPALADSGTPFFKGDNAEEVRGVVVAGSGQGEIIAMNRIRGARAALFCPCQGTRINADVNDADKRGCNVSNELIKASRDHNDSNIFAIGARFCTVEQAKEGIAVWLKTPFSNEERHIRRLAKIEQIVSSK